MEEQKLKCGYGEMGVCCRLCSNGPCRITPDSSKGVCEVTAGLYFEAIVNERPIYSYLTHIDYLYAAKRSTEQLQVL